MKSRVNLTISDSNLIALTNLSELLGKSKSSLVDDLITQTIPVLQITAEVIRKAKHLDNIGRMTLSQDLETGQKTAERAASQASQIIYDLDTKINRALGQINRKKTPSSNTGVKK